MKPFSAALAPTYGSDAPALRLGWLDDAGQPDVPDRIVDGSLRWGAHSVTVTRVERQSVPYADLLDAQPMLRVRVGFASPTYVSRAGRQIPLPDPELLLGGLVRRWTAFSPVPLAAEAVDAMLARVHLARHRIETVAVAAGKGRRVGFVGEATFGLTASADDPSRRVFATLWRFAEFAGVGAQTTHGLGSITLDREVG